jgi:transposase
MAWRRGQSYSEDLRERVLAAVDRGMEVYEAAPLFRVSVSYIYKALGRRGATGEVTARSRLGRPGQRLAALHDALLARVRAEPGATLAELRGWLVAEHGMSVSVGCLWAALDRLELTHKKVLRAAEQDREDVAQARAEWRERQPGLDPKRLVFQPG